MCKGGKIPESLLQERHNAQRPSGQRRPPLARARANGGRSQADGRLRTGILHGFVGKIKMENGEKNIRRISSLHRYVGQIAGGHVFTCVIKWSMLLWVTLVTSLNSLPPGSTSRESTSVIAGIWRKQKPDPFLSRSRLIYRFILFSHDKLQWRWINHESSRKVPN